MGFARMDSHDDTTSIAVDGIDIDRLDEAEAFTLASGVHDVIREDTDHTPKGVGIYVSSSGAVDTTYVGIAGVAENELTDDEGQRLTAYVFSLLRGDLDLAPTETSLPVDYHPDMNGEPQHYSPTE